MPNINISIETLAQSIKQMNKKDMESLLLILTNEGKTLLKRKRDIEQKKVKPLSREETFNV